MILDEAQAEHLLGDGRQAETLQADEARRDFGVEESDALIRLSQFRFEELSLCGGLALCRKEVHFRFGLFGEREDALGNLGVDVRSGEFFEERTLVGMAGFEEVGKAVLRPR